METTIETLREQLKLQLLDRFTKNGAHADLFEALHGISWEQAGETDEHFPYNIWQLAEHIRIAQYDIIEFCRNPDYTSPHWPSGYWPRKASPQDSQEWKKTIDTIRTDHQAFADMLRQGGIDLLKRFDHGTGQSLFNEALLILDHNAYHVGQIILIRKLKGWWH